MLCLLFCAAVGFGTLKNLVIGHSFPNSALPGLAHSLLPTIYCSENCTKWFTNNVLLSNKYNKWEGHCCSEQIIDVGDGAIVTIVK